MNPIWRDIEGYEGYYQVSSTGQVRSLDRVVDYKQYGKRIMKGKMLKWSKDGRGYPCVVLSKNGDTKQFKVHRLVAKTFAYNPHSKPEVNHESGIKTDNGIWNLEFVTHTENIRHAFQIGLYRGKKTLTYDQADQIRVEYVPGSKNANQYALAEKYGVSQSTIKAVVNRKGRYTIHETSK